MSQAKLIKTTSSLERELPAMFVQIDLLKKLETYLKELPLKLAPNKYGDKVTCDFRMEVIDGFGSEEFTSVEHYNRDAFPAGIQRVTLGYILRINLADVASVRISFDVRRGARYQIELDIENSRSIATEISNQLQAKLETGHLKHSVLHSDKSGLLLMGSLWITAAVWGWTSFKNPIVTKVSISLLLIATSLTLIGHFLLPMTIFDSAEARYRKTVGYWILALMGGLLVKEAFGVLTQI